MAPMVAVNHVPGWLTGVKHRRTSPKKSGTKNSRQIMHVGILQSQKIACREDALGILQSQKIACREDERRCGPWYEGPKPSQVAFP